MTAQVNWRVKIWKNFSVDLSALEQKLISIRTIEKSLPLCDISYDHISSCFSPQTK